MSDIVLPADPPNSPANRITLPTEHHLDGWLFWTLGSVWPGLLQFAADGEWAGVRQAGDRLAGELKVGWQAVVQGAELVCQPLRADPRVHPGNVFCRLVQHLNEAWFIPRRLLIDCRPTTATDTPFWFTVFRIDQDQRLATRFGEVRSFLVCALFPRNHGPQLKLRRANPHDPFTGWVRMDVDYWNLCALAQFSYPNDDFRRGCVSSGRREEDVEQDRRIAAAHTRRYPTPHAWQRVQLRRTQTELVRCEIDRRRVLEVDPDAALTGEYRWLVPDVLLPPGCRLRRDLFTPQVDRAAPDAEQEQQRRTQTLTHLSAELTAAAVGGPPQLLVLEWMKTIRFTLSQLPAEPEAPAAPVLHPPEAAARMAVGLLAEQLRLSSAWTFASLRRRDCEQLSILTETLYRRPSEELRLALKAIYAREFDAGPIDDLPFPTIGPTGELLYRQPDPAPPADS